MNSNKLIKVNNDLVKSNEKHELSKAKMFRTYSLRVDVLKRMIELLKEIAKSAILFCIFVLIIRCPRIILFPLKIVGLNIEYMILRVFFYSVFLLLVFCILCFVFNVADKLISKVKFARINDLFITPDDVYMSVFRYSSPTLWSDVKSLSKKFKLSRNRMLSILSDLEKQGKISKDKSKDKIYYHSVFDNYDNRPYKYW